jgi:hypothetical protein
MYSHDLKTRCVPHVALAALLLVKAAGVGFAQGLIQTQGVVVAATDQAVPGLTGVTFGGTGGFDSSVIDESGKVFFRARMVGAGVTALNERGLFYGSSPADLVLVIRGGDPAPTLPGVTLNTATNSGIGSSVRISPDGDMLWSSSLSGTGVVMTNDTAFFTGTPGSFVVAVREGDPAPGTIGATFSSSFSSISQQSTMIDRTGRLLFKSSLTGGDVVGTTNNEGWFYGLPGSLQLILRKGDSLPGGQVAETVSPAFISQSNEAGLVLLDVGLSQTLGTPPATPASDRALWLIDTVNNTKTQLVREGQAAPGTVGATFNNAANTWSLNVSVCALTASGETFLSVELLNGDVVPGMNDVALYRAGPSGTSLLVRRGDAGVGTDGVFNSFNAFSLRMSETGFSFQGSVSGGTSTPATDGGLWVGSASGLTLVAREGDPAPGSTGGALFDTIPSLPVAGLTLPRQALFQVDLFGGIGGSAWYTWDPSNGLTAVVLSGDQIETLPSVFKTISSFGSIQFSNTNNTALCMGHDGKLTSRLGMSDATSAIVTLQLPAFGPTIYCTAKVNSQGCTPQIGFSGTPSASAGSGFNITCGNMIPQANGLLFYSLVGPGAFPFQGGLLCVQPPLTRTPVQNSGGAGPCTGLYDIDFNAHVALGGDPGLVAGAQVWSEYWARDVASPSTTNVTNALAFTLGL